MTEKISYKKWFMVPVGGVLALIAAGFVVLVAMFIARHHRGLVGENLGSFVYVLSFDLYPILLDSLLASSVILGATCFAPTGKKVIAFFLFGLLTALALVKLMNGYGYIVQFVIESALVFVIAYFCDDENYSIPLTPFLAVVFFFIAYHICSYFIILMNYINREWLSGLLSFFGVNNRIIGDIWRECISSLFGAIFFVAAIKGGLDKFDDKVHIIICLGIIGLIVGYSIYYAFILNIHFPKIYIFSAIAAGVGLLTVFFDT